MHRHNMNQIISRSMDGLDLTHSIFLSLSFPRQLSFQNAANDIFVFLLTRLLSL